MRGRKYSLLIYRYGFNGQEKVEEIAQSGDFYTAEYWQYDSRLGRRWNLDPKPNPSVTNYGCFADNPIWFHDVGGDTVRISTGDGKFINYSKGMNYEGNDEFVKATISSLDEIYSTEAGNKVLDELSKSDKHFDYTNVFPKDSKDADIKNALSFVAYKDGGGEIKAGALLNDYMQKGQKIETLAHESFHAYQSVKGENGATINREVGAYLFGRSMAMNLGYGTMGLGNSTTEGTTYNNAMSSLLFGNTFDYSQYEIALKNYKAGSFENGTGLYNNFKIIENDGSPAIKDFFPLIK